MRTEKERERDAKPSGPVAELVAKVQHMLQEEEYGRLAGADEDSEDDEGEVSGE